MKKIVVIFALMLSAAAFAAGEHQVATSQAYVTEELATKQDKFNKLGADTAMTYSGTDDGIVSPRTITGNLGTETNTSDSAIPTVGGVNTKLADQQDTLNLPADTVLMNTGTAGTPAAKGIYDDTASYAAQQDALIDADTFNAAVQNAINAELVCAVHKDENDPTSPCYLFDVVPIMPQSAILPSGYTALEYIESTGTQYIAPGLWIQKDGTARLEMDAQFMPSNGWMGANAYMQLQVGQKKYSIDGNYSQGASLGTRDNIVMEYTNNSLRLYVNGQSKGEKNWSSVSATRSAFMIFALGTYNGGMLNVGKVAGKLYSLKITIDGVISNFVPARRDNDGVLGMYETSTNTFFTNSGTGTFIAGPVTGNLYIPQNQ